MTALAAPHGITFAVDDVEPETEPLAVKPLHEELRDAFKKIAADEGFTRLISSIRSRVDYLDGPEFEKLLERERADLKAMAANLKN